MTQVDTVIPQPAPSPATAAPSPIVRTIWGLDPVQLLTRYWAAHGVQVVRQGEPSEIVKHAELFLLCDPRSLVLFKLGPIVDALNWIKPQVLLLRIHDASERGYRENVLTDDQDRFVRFERVYGAASRLARVCLTPEREIAQMWQSAPDPLSGWRRVRRFIRKHDRATLSVEGSFYERDDHREIAYFLSDLLQAWKRPDSTIARIYAFGQNVWKDPSSSVNPSAKFIGPCWIGAGRKVEGSSTVVGPVVMWDDPVYRPATDAIQWLTIEPTAPPDEPAVRVDAPFNRAFKRFFDIVFSIAALLITLPIYPFIILAIWLEDGRPFFFTHMRETIGGREFPCLKFRSMRKDAEKIKAQLKQLNQADGPQFYMENDPRLTRVGRLLRRYNLDELPQFFNVLLGHMAIVGPRPSPFSENQFCPAWREARLSVRPGITGLWQIKRTRRAGSDFQEWIKYDLEYVEKRNWGLDLLIIWKTVSTLLGKVSRS